MLVGSRRFSVQCKMLWLCKRSPRFCFAVNRIQPFSDYHRRFQKRFPSIALIHKRHFTVISLQYDLSWESNNSFTSIIVCLDKKRMVS